MSIIAYNRFHLLNEHKLRRCCFEFQLYLTLARLHATDIYIHVYTLLIDYIQIYIIKFLNNIQTCTSFINDTGACIDYLFTWVIISIMRSEILQNVSLSSGLYLINPHV